MSFLSYTTESSLQTFVFDTLNSVLTKLSKQFLRHLFVYSMEGKGRYGSFQLQMNMWVYR